MAKQTATDYIFHAIIGVFAIAVIGIGAFAGYAVIDQMVHPRGGFGCRSAQAEAKSNLLGLFTAEKAFYGEYGVYSTDLESVYWVPDGSPRYLYGFAQPGGPDDIEGIDHLDPTRHHTGDPRLAKASDGGERYHSSRMQNLDGTPLEASDLPTTALVAGSSFIAAAIGDIDPDGNVTRLDIWTINEKRELVVLSNDCVN